MGALTYWMEFTMWIVLGSMAVDFLVGMINSLRRGKFSHELVLVYLRDIVNYIFPLLILAGISVLDSTGWIVQVGYYLGAIAVFVKYLLAIKAKF